MRRISRPFLPLSTRKPSGTTTSGASRSPSAKIDQDPGGVGRELDAGTGFLKSLRLLKYGDVKVAAR